MTPERVRTALMASVVVVVAAAVLFTGLRRAEISDWITDRVGYTGFWILFALAFGVLLFCAHLLDRGQPRSRRRRR